jgi:DNA-binding response OmpR family regulator
MVTARGQVKDREIATELGADAYFVKPFSPLALANHIKEHPKK